MYHDSFMRNFLDTTVFYSLPCIKNNLIVFVFSSPRTHPCHHHNHPITASSTPSSSNASIASPLANSNRQVNFPLSIQPGTKLKKEHYGAYYCWKNNSKICTSERYNNEDFLGKILCDFVRYSALANRDARCLSMRTATWEPTTKNPYPNFWFLKTFLDVCLDVPESVEALKTVLNTRSAFGWHNSSLNGPSNLTLFMQACQNPDVDTELVSIFIDLIKTLGGRQLLREQLIVLSDSQGQNAVMLACSIPRNLRHVSCIFRAVAEFDDTDKNNPDDTKDETEKEVDKPSSMPPFQKVLLFQEVMSFAGLVNTTAMIPLLQRKPTAMIPFLHACKSADSELVDFLLDRLEHFIIGKDNEAIDDPAKEFVKLQLTSRSDYGNGVLQFLCLNGKINGGTVRRVCSRLLDLGIFAEEYENAISKEKYCKVHLVQLGITNSFSASSKHYVKRA